MGSMKSHDGLRSGIGTVSKLERKRPLGTSRDRIEAFGQGTERIEPVHRLELSGLLRVTVSSFFEAD
jgi:hypothetical protein